MSISVEDLVSSLSSSHIGQEAIDIATLQVGCSYKPIRAATNDNDFFIGTAYPNIIWAAGFVLERATGPSEVPTAL